LSYFHYQLYYTIDIQHNTTISHSVAEAESELGDNGRIVLRPSGTEPLIRVMVEGVDADIVRQQCEALAEVVREAAGQSRS
jgi:phosphoglucosamine mutase